MKAKDVDAILSAISALLALSASGLMTAFSALSYARTPAPATALILTAGILLAVTAVYKCVALVLERKGVKTANAFTVIPEATALLIGMIGGIMLRGQYTMTVEILFFALTVVEGLALTAMTVGWISPKKGMIVCVGLAALSVLALFFPVFVGQASVAGALQRYAAYSLADISTALLAARTRYGTYASKNK